MNDVLKKLSDIGIIPVAKIDDAQKAVPIAKALCDGGLPCIEVTFRTDKAEESIRRITESLPHVLVGAGTVLTTEQADRAVEAGAKFIVSPGFNTKLVSHCLEKNITVIPGCSSPTDIEAAMSFGFDVVKFFPADALGGVKYIKAVSAPYSGIKFIPTGGINEKNLNEYLSCPNVIACGGSWMLKESLMQEGAFDQITALTREAVKAMMGFELIHVGINCENDSEAYQTAVLLCNLFGLEPRETNLAIFAGKYFEVMKTPYRGKNGHIAIGTNCLERGVAYMESRGFKMDIEGASKDKEGKLTGPVYFEQEIGGFAFHLIQK